MDGEHIDLLIENLLQSRAVPAPPPMFTQGVMRKVQRDRWRVEQAVDLGFNLAVAAGVLLIVGGAVGLAWSAGVLVIDLDLPALAATVTTSWAGRVVAQARTVAMAAGLLSMALGVWWWAEANPSL